MSTDELLSAAMQLPPDDKEELANQLLDSLYAASDDDFGPAWTEEIEARVKALDEGRLKTVPTAEALRQLRERLQKRVG